MTRASISILMIVCLVLAGCSAIDGETDQTPTETDTTTRTPTASTTTDAADATSTATATATTTDATTTTTTMEPWSEPTPPNTPLQNKMGSEDRDRMKDVSVVDRTEASGGGYSDFALQITADTRMENVDPEDHGDVVGEPYFLVYVDGSLDNGSRFSYTNGTLAERADVSQEENGEFTVDVHPEALERAGVEEGEVDVLVLMMDEDKDWDDIYAVRTVTVEYSSGE